MNKRGESSMIPIIVAIALGAAVLIFMIFGFTMGWGNFWDRITGGGAGQANLDTIMSDCQLACTSGKTTDYCQDIRDIKFGKEAEIIAKTVKAEAFTMNSTTIKTTCNVIAKHEGIMNVKGTNYNLTDIQFKNLNVPFSVQTCPAIKCI